MLLSGRPTQSAVRNTKSMNPRAALLSATLGAVTGLPVVALYSLGNRLAALPFVPFDVFD